jgi:hypothetical protein
MIVFKIFMNLLQKYKAHQITENLQGQILKKMVLGAHNSMEGIN